MGMRQKFENYITLFVGIRSWVTPSIRFLCGYAKIGNIFRS